MALTSSLQIFDYDHCGNRIVEGFMDKITAILGKREKVYIWVIATVDKVVETEKGIDLIGRAVPFVPYG